MPNLGMAVTAILSLGLPFAVTFWPAVSWLLSLLTDGSTP